MGVGSTYMLSKSAWYSRNSSSRIFKWTGMPLRSRAGDSPTGSLEAAVSDVVLTGEVPP